MLVIPKLEIQAATTRDARAVDDPMTAARGWAAEGYGRLQIVDVDALGGRRRNASTIESVARDTGVEVDVVAGADSADQIEAWIDCGATRVVLGARALSDDD